MDQSNQTASPSSEDTYAQDGGTGRPILRINRSDSGTRGKTAEDTDNTISLDSPDLYINRELSHLQFNIRVLEQALDTSHPLLNRLMFLLIFSSNLDEFFEIRVAGLKRQVAFSREKSDADGMMPQEVIRQINDICHEQIERQYSILNDELIPAMEQEGIRFLRRADWCKKQSEWV
ncbi:MAG: RNA degradosome polyphosphate kinase, partial [Oceanospirillum sp.]|nr:RNA degradosome polyphosphate kinase [Oceanospirillum sp.]